MNAVAKHLAQPTAADPLLDDLLAEFGNQVHAADAVDMEAFISAHPERAEPLRRLLPAIQVLANLEPSAGPAVGGPYPPGPEDQTALGELGDYRLLREIGRGGMGVVYEAEQISLRRRVALKVLPFAAALDGKQLQRFKNEAQAAAGLHHTNIVPVHAVGCERGVHYYAMQFIEGQTLAALIEELRQFPGSDAVKPAAPRQLVSELAKELASGKWALAKKHPAELQPTGPDPLRPVGEGVGGVERTETPDRAGSADTLEPPAAAVATERSTKTPAFFRTVATLGVQAAQALEHAHQFGVVHRDIKPANLLVDGRGNLWITDFGLAHCQSQVGLTMTGDLVGTLRYMSPEQALAKRVIVDHRTDIYSLGATLYELLTLHPVFAGRDRHELLRQIAFEEPRPPRRRNKAIPAELETIVLKAMEKNPADRYATAEELADDLARYLKDEPIRAKRPTLMQRARKWVRRHKAVVTAVAACAVAALVIAVVGLAISNRLIDQERAQTKEANARLISSLVLAEHTLDGVYLKVAEWLPRDPERKREYYELLEKVLGFYQQLADGTDPRMRVNLAYFHVKFGNLLLAGDQAKAADHYRRALDLQSKVVADCPGVAAHEDRLAFAHMHLADLLTQTGQTDEAAKHYKRGFQIVEKQVAEWSREPDGGRGPGAAACYACLAWNLATCVDPRFRDPDRAVQAGQKAANLDASPWRSVGIAHYRAGDCQAAVAALEKTIQSGGEVTELFLAMAHWKLGKKEQARQWYGRAIQRMPSGPEWFPVRHDGFRAEAADLFRIDKDQEVRDGAPAKR